MYILLPLLLFGFGLSITSEEIYDNSWALLIGIDNYDNLKGLNYSVKDAQSIRKMLVDEFQFPPENIILLLDDEATKNRIIKELSNFAKKAGANDRVLIYFAGHGDTEDLPDGGVLGYLMPVDGDKEVLFVSSIEMDVLEKVALRSNAKHLLYLIDACYGGLATVSTRGLDTKKTSNYIDKITKYKSRQIISEGGKDAEVIEKAIWGHSAFTKNLLSGLKDWKADSDNDGVITTYELGGYLKKNVSIDSGNLQTPKIYNFTNDEGEFLFINSAIQMNIQKSELETPYEALVRLIGEEEAKKIIIEELKARMAIQYY